MPDLISSAGDLFTVDSLSFINRAPYVPGEIAASGVCEEGGMPTTTVQVEVVNGQVRVIQSSPRGGPAPVHPRDTRTTVSFTAPHIRVRDTVLVSSWQDRRGFGEATPADVQRERDRMLASMRGSLETTIEYHRARALSGQILDADGSVLMDLLSEFGVSQNTLDMNLDIGLTNVRNQIVAAVRKSEVELGAMRAPEYIAFCSASYFDAVCAHPSVSSAFEASMLAKTLAADLRTGFVFGGVTHVEVRNPPGITMIEDGAAYLVPKGVPGLFKTHYAPADYIETANTEGLPLYAKAQELPFNRGWMIEAQTNPVSIISRPRAVVKLTA